jgi:hypothetical protein
VIYSFARDQKNFHVFCAVCLRHTSIMHAKRSIDDLILPSPQTTTKKHKPNDSNIEDKQSHVISITGRGPFGNAEPTATLVGDRQVLIEFETSEFPTLLTRQVDLSSEYMTQVSVTETDAKWLEDARRCPGALILPRECRLWQVNENVPDMSFCERISFSIDFRRSSLLAPVDDSLIPELRNLVYQYYKEPGMKETCEEPAAGLPRSCTFLDIPFRVARRRTTARICEARYEYWRCEPGRFNLPMFRQTEAEGVEYKAPCCESWVNLSELTKVMDAHSEKMNKPKAWRCPPDDLICAPSVGVHPLNPLFRPVCVVNEADDDEWDFTVNDALFPQFYVEGFVKW